MTHPISDARASSAVSAVFHATGAMVDTTDAELVERCLAGDSPAWSTLVRRYQRLVYAIVTRMGLDEHMAADVFQTVFTRLLEHLPRITDPTRLQAWIVTTAKREGLLQRKLARRTESMTTGDDEGAPEWDIADESPIAEDVLADLQQLHHLREAMSRLDDRSRRLLLLLFPVDGHVLPYETVAREMGIPVGSIGPTRARCLEKLRRIMAAM